tara:strand:+ start:126 stop:458 length:333 start_codon:yes stop_codon:yes gene_type:complete
MAKSKDVPYGRLTKRIVFTDTDHRHAQLIIRLKHDKIRQSEFFRAIITGYIEGDERICTFVEEAGNLSKKRKTQSRKLRTDGQRAKEKMGLSTEDVQGIFDLIAEEHPDL